jgi:hypothetical protein
VLNGTSQLGIASEINAIRPTSPAQDAASAAPRGIEITRLTAAFALLAGMSSRAAVRVGRVSSINVHWHSSARAQ